MYKINDMNMNGQPSYVFKMGKHGHIHGARNRAKSPMQNELCYFDQMHRTYDGWKTLDIMGFHPSSRKLLRLATVEVKGEASQHVTLFWKDTPCFTEKEKSLIEYMH